mgnify:CR=1 FL=1|tara:strand:- start:580 stop:711 length:132 start_codon:yes stop_codon:yes gene_type:complete
MPWTEEQNKFNTWDSSGESFDSTTTWNELGGSGDWTEETNATE